MKSINIKTPCQEDWASMTIVEKNRFCQSCQKVVVNFEAMSDEEVIAYLDKQKGQKTCGRFTNIQLDRINQKINSVQPKEKASTSLIKPILAATILAATTSTAALSQESNSKEVNPTEVVETEKPKEEKEGTHTKIYGTVKSAETNELLPDVRVWIEGTMLRTSTDKEGKFELSIPTQEIAPTSIHFGSMYWKNSSVSLIVKLNSWENHEMDVKLERKIYTEEYTEMLLGAIMVERKLPFYKRVWKKIKSLFTKKK